VFVFCLAAFLQAAEKLPSIIANNNHSAAGILKDGVLHLALEIQTGQWCPENEGGDSMPILAFNEEGKAPQIPGPMLNVVEGTQIDVSIHNRTAALVSVYGLHIRPGPANYAIQIPADERRRITFRTGKAGIYYYWAKTAAKDFGSRDGEDGQLSGAFLVQSAQERSKPVEHVFLIGVWNSPTRGLWVINGKMWPYTERLSEKVGAPMRTIWINPSFEDHPMHLHGGYFTVLREGDSESTERYQPVLRPVAATHLLESGKTMEIEWSAQHPGNWLFHCHIFFHTDFRLGLNPPEHHDMNWGSLRHMTGLAIGFTAIGNNDVVESQNKSPRKVDLYISERDEHYAAVEGLGDHFTGMGYSLREDEPPSNPGPPIFLTRGQPVEITIHNRLKEATSVHWHGIELESYYDGVPGWGGIESQKTPIIAPGESFIAKFTPPREGSFMYHTHLNDTIQLSVGLSGPLIVLEPDRPYDPSTDKIFFISRDGPDDEKAPFLLNGSTSPEAMTLKAHLRYRLRFLAMTTAMGAQLFLCEKGEPVRWKAIAKDGADLNTAQATMLEATQRIEPGETYDFEWNPDAGEYRLEGRGGKGQVRFAQDIRVEE
jgi:manganese oxidase